MIFAKQLFRSLNEIEVKSNESIDRIFLSAIFTGLAPISRTLSKGPIMAGEERHAKKKKVLGEYCFEEG